MEYIELSTIYKNLTQRTPRIFAKNAKFLNKKFSFTFHPLPPLPENPLRSLRLSLHPLRENSSIEHTLKSVHEKYFQNGYKFKYQ